MALYQANTGLIGFVLSRSFARLTPAQREEAEQWARLGLFHAARRYDQSRGVQFSTYGSRCILTHVYHGLRQEKRQNRVACVSLSTPLAGDGEGRVLGDAIPDPDAQAALEALLDGLTFDTEIGRFVDRLPARERFIIAEFYGRQRTIMEIAAGLGRSRQAVSILHKRALKRLRFWASHSSDLSSEGGSDDGRHSP